MGIHFDPMKTLEIRVINLFYLVGRRCTFSGVQHKWQRDECFAGAVHSAWTETTKGHFIGGARWGGGCERTTLLMIKMEEFYKN
jgi:hypothetical protein